MIAYIINSIADYKLFESYYLSKGLVWRNNRPVFDTLDEHVTLPYALILTEVSDNNYSYKVAFYRDITAVSTRYTVSSLPQMLTPVEVFRIFLKHHNAYEKYITQDFQYTVNMQFSQLLIDAFDWEDSFEGYEYWDDLDDKWRILIHNLKLNPNEVIPNLLNILH